MKKGETRKMKSETVNQHKDVKEEEPVKEKI